MSKLFSVFTLLLVPVTQNGEHTVNMEEGEQDGGDWVYEESSDPFDDTVSKSIALESKNGGASLFVSCNEGEDLGLGIGWKVHIGSDSALVKYRVGTKAPEDAVWAVSKNWTIIYPVASTHKNATKAELEKEIDRSQGQIIGLLSEMVGESKFVVRATKFDDSTVDATFAISGLKIAVEPILDYCSVELNTLTEEDVEKVIEQETKNE